MQDRLRYRARGSTTWIDVDINTPWGRHLLALLFPKGTAMTATAERLYKAPPGTTGQSEPASDMVLGFWAKTKQFVSNTWGIVAGGIAKAWGWLRSTLHLEAVTSRVATASAWAWGKIQTAAEFMGAGGLTGAALLTVSTSTGRKVISFALSPITWSLKKVGQGYVALENALHNDTRKGGVRNWISDRMADFRMWLIGGSVDEVVDANGKVLEAADYKLGILSRAWLWFWVKVGRHLQVDSLAMRSLRAVGTVLFLWPFVGLAGFLPFAAVIKVALVIGIVVLVLGAFVPEIEKAAIKLEAYADRKAFENIVATEAKFAAIDEQMAQTRVVVRPDLHVKPAEPVEVVNPAAETAKRILSEMEAEEAAEKMIGDVEQAAKATTPPKTQPHGPGVHSASPNRAQRRAAAKAAQKS